MEVDIGGGLDGSWTAAVEDRKGRASGPCVVEGSANGAGRNTIGPPRANEDDPEGQREETLSSPESGAASLEG